MPTSWPVRWDLRTSETHPLIISGIKHPAFSGEIGITLCPGKYQPTSWSGGWNRNLDQDISVLKSEGISTVVSLVEQVEMDFLRVPNLGQAIIQQGIDWIHLPFRDTTAPDNAWTTRFNTVKGGLIDSIQSGERIMVHCKGGLGRAGTVTALLLIELGLVVDDAISLVRKIRGADCINPKQEDFLRSLV